MLLKREVICSFRRIASSHPVSWAIKETYSDNSVRYSISFRKSYNFNSVFFDSFSELDHYSTIKGWI